MKNFNLQEVLPHYTQSSYLNRYLDSCLGIEELNAIKVLWNIIGKIKIFIDSVNFLQ